MRIWLDHALLQRPISCKEEVIFDWPALLVYIGAGALLKSFLTFEHLFESIAITDNIVQKDLFTEFFDQLFIECLTDVKEMKEINASFLLESIQNCRREKPVLNELNRYEQLLISHPYEALHDLTLYLAFDRVAVALAVLFERSANSSGLDVLRDCLIESFHHITKQGKTRPSFFRFAESLYAYQMRQEFLDRYSEEDWLTLCQSALALRPRDELMNAVYIDPFLKEKVEETVITLDSPEKVKATFLLSHYMIKHLQETVPYWDSTLHKPQIEHALQ